MTIGRGGHDRGVGWIKSQRRQKLFDDKYSYQNLDIEYQQNKEIEVDDESEPDLPQVPGWLWGLSWLGAFGAFLFGLLSEGEFLAGVVAGIVGLFFLPIVYKIIHFIIRGFWVLLVAAVTTLAFVLFVMSVSNR